MEKIVRKIIEDIPGGCIFDSHYVIKSIIDLNMDDYLRFADTYIQDKSPTGLVNANIGRLIAKQEDLCVQLAQQSFSRHLRDEGSKCAAFERK